MGECGMSYRDFRSLTISELAEVIKRHRESAEARRRDRWERMRLHAAMTMQPHCKNRLSPQRLLPFPWENGPQQRSQSTQGLDKAQAKVRFESLMAALRQTPEG